MENNPYQGLPDHHFWRRAMLDLAPGQINPSVPTFQIGRAEKVVTMGSCFAQHLAREIKACGLTYLESESGPSELGYGVFSARYGNVYTARQALQLKQMAFGEATFEQQFWQLAVGPWIDGFRPGAVPQGFETLEEARLDRAQHLKAVRQLFEQADWMVFTLGLTEAWVNSADGAILPLAPGVNGGEFDACKHSFKAFNVIEVINDLTQLIDSVRQINPNMKWLFTVSPVPLIATYQSQHVLTSTVESKAVLRASADYLAKQYQHVYYFPSFEIINSPANEGRYFEDDLRSVSPLGVKHVMRVFAQHMQLENREPRKLNHELNDSPVICEEEFIERSLKEV